MNGVICTIIYNFAAIIELNDETMTKSYRVIRC